MKTNNYLFVLMSVFLLLDILMLAADKVYNYRPNKNIFYILYSFIRLIVWGAGFVITMILYVSPQPLSDLLNMTSLIVLIYFVVVRGFIFRGI